MKSRLFGLGAMLSIMAVAAGARMTAAPADTVPTFNKDVAPIVFDNCVSCHRPNQIAPMSLMSYQEVRPWARAIKNKVVKREMPPWFADPRFGEFRNDPRLTDEQIKTIATWADAGAPQGETPLVAELPTLNDGWTHPSGRDPDLVIEMADVYNGPAEGEVPWFNIYQELPEELKKEEHFIEAIQLLPGVIPAMHHMQWDVRPLPPGTKIGRGEAWPGGQIIEGALLDSETGQLADSANSVSGAEGAPRDRRNRFSFCCYVPGGTFRQYQDGAFKRMPKEGIIVWGAHYTMIGKPFADKSKVGLWFQEDPKNEIGSGQVGGNIRLVQGRELVDDDVTPPNVRGQATGGRNPAVPVIPPHTADFSLTQISAYQDDVTLYTVWPHMHLRGHEMTFVVTFPDGREQILLANLNFDFNWQLFYDLKEPLKIPAGSTIKAIGSYDNSTRNVNNSEPHKEVYWSEQSWDEMFTPFRDVTVDKNALDVTEARKSSTDDGRQ